MASFRTWLVPAPNLIRGKYHRDGSTPQNFRFIVDLDRNRNPHRSRFIGLIPRQVQHATRSTLPILLHGDSNLRDAAFPCREIERISNLRTRTRYAIISEDLVFAGINVL